MYAVYKILNVKNKKFYIGSTNNFEVRKSEHLGQYPVLDAIKKRKEKRLSLKNKIL